MSGHATIDFIRAVKNLCEHFNLTVEANVALWGYSGGALGTERATELKPQYAPELDLIGAAMGGLTPNLTRVLDSVNGKAPAGLAVSSILGLGSQYPGVLENYVSQLHKSGLYNATTFLSAKKLNGNQVLELFAFQDLNKYFKDGLSPLLNYMQGRIAFANDGIMGYHGVPKCPLYIYKAIHDEVSPVEDTDKLVERYCQVGSNIAYVKNKLGDHSQEGSSGASAAFAWLTTRLSTASGMQYQSYGCTTEVVSIN